MELNANAFSKCAPAISTDIRHCGSVALCNAQPLTTGDLTDAYMKSDDFRVLEHLLMADMEIKQCEAVQNGLYEFLMANKVNLSHKVVPQGINADVIQIAPFIKADQYSPINNEFWKVSGGTASGQRWQVSVTSATNIPADARSFPVGLRVYIVGSNGGIRTDTAYRVYSAVAAGSSVTLVLDKQNADSFLEDDQVTDPVTGYLRRGNNNVSDYESECNEMPAYLNNKLVPFWVQTSRWSWCNSTAYTEYRQLMLKTNALYRKFFDLPETKRNKQLMADQQKRFVNSFFYAKPLPNQTLANYDQLEEITAFDANDLGLGIDGVCVGKRAEATGVIEQLAECGRVVDLAGAALNLPALFQAFYDICRVREGQGNRNRIIDVFTDTVTAELINQAMLAYYNSKSQNMLRLTMDVSGFSVAKKADFGFYYRSYPLFWPQGVTMNVLTHFSFDDELSVATAVGIEDVGRQIWVLDFSGIYPGIIASNRVVHKTGDLKTLASINTDFACVLKVHTQEQSLFSMTHATIVECPAGNLVLQNLSAEVPSIEAEEGVRYPTTTTTTTGA